MAIKEQYQRLVGSLLWLSQSTQPDLSTITNMLSKHQNSPNDKHIISTEHAIKYLKGSKNKGITFDSDTTAKFTSYVHFPLGTQKIQGISDANWGPQDQTNQNLISLYQNFHYSCPDPYLATSLPFSTQYTGHQNVKPSQHEVAVRRKYTPQMNVKNIFYTFATSSRI